MATAEGLFVFDADSHRCELRVEIMVLNTREL